MNDLLVNVVVLGGAWVLVAMCDTTRKVPSLLTVGLVLFASGFGLFRGVLVAADVATLVRSTDLLPEVLTLGAWAAFGAAAAKSGWREPSRWAPVAFGLFLGEVGGAFLAAAGNHAPADRARRVMASTAGALMARTADPALFTASQGSLALPILGCVALSGLAGILLAAPPAGAAPPPHRPTPVLVVASAVWLLSWIPSLELGVVAVGALVLWGLRRAVVEPAPLLRTTALLWTGLIVVAAGGAEAWADWLESRIIPNEANVPLLVWASGALGGLALGSDGGGFLGRAVADRALAVRDPLAASYWAMGAAVAGLGPYLLTGTLWRALPRHAVWLVVSGAVFAAAHFGGAFAP